jgi:organic hydroperoxide reductase OsmC/OhrA
MYVYAKYFLPPDIEMTTVSRTIGQGRLVDEAHEICPYSRAIRGTIEVAIKLV